jgi:TonB family protein
VKIFNLAGRRNPMNKKFALSAGLIVLLAVAFVSAQNKDVGDYAGNWTLDTEKSELGERSRIESMTMEVRQTETDLTVERKATLAERENNDDGRRGGGMGRGGGFGDGERALTFDLGGKETLAAPTGGGRGGEIKLKAEVEKDGTLKLTQTRNIESPRGEITVKTVETWKKSADGNTLTVTTETETPRGKRSMKMVFTRPMIISSDSGGKPLASTKEATNGFKMGTSPAGADGAKRISGGVVNGKANNLEVPTYPAAARMAGVRGTVIVRVLIDKEGNVVEAEAVSGDVLLQKAAVEAALKSKFGTTTLEGEPVEVSGVIVYNFQ